MKKVTTIFGALLIAAVVLTSCETSSEKGNETSSEKGNETSSEKGKWNESDMNACLDDINKDMENDQEAIQGMKMFGITLEGFSTCACEKLEDNYASWADANDAGESIDDAEAMEMFFPCFGKEFEEMMKSAY